VRLQVRSVTLRSVLGDVIAERQPSVALLRHLDRITTGRAKVAAVQPHFRNRLGSDQALLAISVDHENPLTDESRVSARVENHDHIARPVSVDLSVDYHVNTPAKCRPQDEKATSG
jgi:hypothetical protein